MRKEDLQKALHLSAVPYLNDMVSATIYVFQIALRKSYFLYISFQCSQSGGGIEEEYHEIHQDAGMRQ